MWIVAARYLFRFLSQVLGLQQECLRLLDFFLQQIDVSWTDRPALLLQIIHHRRLVLEKWRTFVFRIPGPKENREVNLADFVTTDNKPKAKKFNRSETHIDVLYVGCMSSWVTSGWLWDICSLLSDWLWHFIKKRDLMCGLEALESRTLGKFVRHWRI